MGNFKSLETTEMFEQIANLRGHYILCGAGRTGIHIAGAFSKLQHPFVVIEQNPDMIGRLQGQIGSDLLWVRGDASEDEILRMAGIEQASGLITTLRDDKDNAFVVLTARSLNPNLRIVARVDDEEVNVEKMRKAGADMIVLPNLVGGMRLASEMIRPEVINFFTHIISAPDKSKQVRFTELHVNEIKLPVLATDQLCISDVGRHTDLLVVAIKRAGKYQYKPKGNTPLRRSSDTASDDVLVVVSTQEELERVRGEVS